MPIAFKSSAHLTHLKICFSPTSFIPLPRGWKLLVFMFKLGLDRSVKKQPVMHLRSPDALKLNIQSLPGLFLIEK